MLSHQAPKDRGGAQLLIVDDDPDSREIVRFQLEAICAEHGLECIQAADAEEARKLLESPAHELRLAVVDLRMPDPNSTEHEIDEDSGIKLCRDIRSGGMDFPIIVHTNRFDQRAKHQCEAIAGIAYYLERPWVSETLRGAVRRCLAGKAPRKMVVLETGDVFEEGRE